MSTESEDKPQVYVNAFACERVIRDKSDILTAVQITNGYTVNPIKLTLRLPDGSPDEEHAQLVFQPLSVSVVISFYAERPSEFTFTIKAKTPSGR